MKKVIAIAPTSYQLKSVRNFGSEVTSLKNGSHVFEKFFETEKKAKEYLIVRAELYFEEESKLENAIEEIEKYGSVRLDAVKGSIEDVPMKTVYTLYYDNGSSVRYIDEEDSKTGTHDEYSAKYFDTKEEAQAFADERGYICGVSELEIES